MAINKERIKKQIQRAISNLPTNIELKRVEEIDLGYDSYEKQEITVATFQSFVDNGGSKLDTRVGTQGDFGKINRIKSISLIAIYDENFEIRIGDYFYLQGLKHRIAYPKNQYGIYWECDVEVVAND